jgi:hypothetical protein
MLAFGLNITVTAQAVDSTEQQAAVLPPTSKSKQSEAATKYSTPPRSKSDWRKKIYLGGYFGAGFGSYTNIEISPIIGYNFTNDFSMGVGVIYSYYSYDFGPTKIQSNNWGFRVNANYILFNFVRLGAEYQFLNVDAWTGDLNPNGTPVYEKEPYNILFLGGGINQRVGRNASVFLMIYYDVLQNGYYNDNYIIRVGVAAGF